MTCIYKLIEGLVPDSAGAQTPLTKSRADTITSPNEIKPERQSYHCNCSIRRIADCLLTQLLLVQRSGFHGGSEAAPQVRKIDSRQSRDRAFAVCATHERVCGKWQREGQAQSFANTRRELSRPRLSARLSSNHLRRQLCSGYVGYTTVRQSVQKSAVSSWPCSIRR